jgi:hypothetical protein
MNLAHILVASAATLLGADAQPPQDQVPPEMKVLEMFVGNWKSVTTPAPPGEGEGIGRAKAKRVLNGRFIQVRHVDDDGKLTAMTMYTYHVPSQQYRVYHFGSDGEAEHGIGKWDAETRTLTFTKTPADRGVWTYAARMVDDDTREGKFKMTDQEGAVVVDIVSKSTRQKDQVAAAPSAEPRWSLVFFARATQHRQGQATRSGLATTRASAAVAAERSSNTRYQGSHGADRGPIPLLSARWACLSFRPSCARFGLCVPSLS